MASLAVILTDTQLADLRRHLGYPNQASDDDTTAPYYRYAALEALDYRLNHLRAEEAAFVTSQLKNINTCYANWIAAQDNLATTSVSIITRNPNEMPQRYALYVQLCQNLASWIGVAYRGMGGDASRVII
jgi:hypothetical protein